MDYNSTYTGAEVQKRLEQGTYDDAVAAGYTGTKADFDTMFKKLNPSYLSNDTTGKKVEYTNDGKLLFEGKETFSVDDDSELTLAGKKLSELGGRWIREHIRIASSFDVLNTKSFHCDI
ncbi:MAG: hypothetical protein LUD46_20480 [Parabacteroides sp.]|nr:hypothetical protein [Parabacteroides sp.]